MTLDTTAHPSSPSRAHPSHVLDRHGPTGVVDLELVVPVYNEEAVLARSVRTLRAYCDEALPFTVRILIADNASTDGTWDIAAKLVEELDGVSALRLGEKGRGRALRAAWMASTARVVAYMDVDLSTGLAPLGPLVAPLLDGSFDVAVTSRLAPGARVVRTARREVISRAYNVLLRVALGSSIKDAQCGCKAVRGAVLPDLVDQVDDQAWFFDTELLDRAQRLGLRTTELPIEWVDDLDSRVAIVSTARDDLAGVARLLSSRRSRPRVARARHQIQAPVQGQAHDGAVFADELWGSAGLGVAPLGTYAAVLGAGGLLLGAGAGLMVANVVAVGAAAVVAGRARGEGWRRLGGFDRWAATTVLVGGGLVVTSTAVAVGGLAGGVAGVSAGVAASGICAVGGFTILRTWVFPACYGVVGGGDAGAVPSSVVVDTSTLRVKEDLVGMGTTAIGSVR